jgi:hypothetical protein
MPPARRNTKHISFIIDLDLYTDIMNNEEGATFTEQITNRLTKKSCQTPRELDEEAQIHLLKAKHLQRRALDLQRDLEEQTIKKEIEKKGRQEISEQIPINEMKSISVHFELTHKNWENQTDEINTQRLKRIIEGLDLYREYSDKVNMNALWLEIKDIIKERKHFDSFE